LARESTPAAALRGYETERLSVANRVVLENRTQPPDAIIDKVERLTGGRRFDKIEDVISQNELREMLERYQRIAGYDRQSVARNADGPAGPHD
jgi:hypothetical protein